MPNLHAHYHNGNVKAFRQELDGTPVAPLQRAAGPSSSGGRSWTMSGMSQPPVRGDPNERDAQGRTVLHLAASINTQQAYSFFSVLLRNPNLSVNLQDYESGYTALHRALYAGNIRVARDLLARSDIDISVKDSEGLTAFDLYNSTVEGTNPPSDVDGTDLYVWGVNRNYALGTGDSTDKAFPDHVNLLTQRQASDHPDPAQRFYHVGVKDVKMAKLHTAVVTSESRGNLSLCGFGNGGRLGQSIHSQLSLLPLPNLPHSITSIALGQDHTLALTSGGYILSWGKNGYSQLGYAIEAPEKPSPFAKENDGLVQVSPKRIVGPLKKEWVRGVAAGRMSSACWTADSVWTWGTNLGHLGYEKTANPVQVNPRKVTAISQPVIDVALSDYAMICLLDSFEVLCFHHDTHFKINFGSPQRSLKVPRNPGQASRDTNICKVTSCGQTFATLSKKGDVCTFTLPHPSEEANKEVRDRHVTVKPQVVWALRKTFTAVKDMALGSDGTMIICTHSGHVFVRQRPKQGAGLKFRRIPYLQRIIKVATNDSGAFAAVRVDAKPTPISLMGKTLEEDMFLLQPHFRRFENQMTAEDFERQASAAHDKDADEDDDEVINSVAHDSVVAVGMCQILDRWQASNLDSLFAWSESLLGSDISIVVGEHSIPAHSTILSLRSPVFARLLSGSKVEGFELSRDGEIVAVTMDACHPLVALLLLQYLYSDDIAAIWDARVAELLQAKFGLKLLIGDIKADVRRFATVLELAPLVSALSLSSKTPIPSKTLASDLASFFNRTSTPPSTCDVVLALEDREVACQSVLLRARCPFFEAMFADRDWTLDRRADGKVVIHMEHLRWRPMKLVFKFIHEGVEDDLFDYLHQETLDGFLDFVFEVLAAATELLMDRLVLVCSRVIARHCNPYNAASLASEASFYQATTLKLSIFDYIVACMETMLESDLLTDMEDDVMRDLMAFISRKQLDKAVVPRSNLLVDELMIKHKEWISVQDIPVPRVRAPIKWKPRSPLLAPNDGGRKSPKSPLSTPDLKPLQSVTAVDEMFTMDDVGPSPQVQPAAGDKARPMTPLSLSAGTSKGPVWKSKTVASDKVDLRSIMAEASASKTPVRAPVSLAGSSPSASPKLTPAAGPPRTPGSASSGPSTGPWRAVDNRKTSLSAVQAAQSTSPVATPLISRAPGSQASPVPQRGNVITPVRAAATSTPRRTGGAAWSTPTTFTPPSPMPRTSPQVPTQSFSLLAIQQEEENAANRSTQKVVRSFAEIQAEERAAEAARAQEEDFMRWWAEEEARVKGSPNGSAQAPGSQPRAESGRGRGRGQKRIPQRGRGRGGGGGAAGAEGGREPQANGTTTASPGSGDKRGKGRESQANGERRPVAEQQANGGEKRGERRGGQANGRGGQANGRGGGQANGSGRKRGAKA